MTTAAATLRASARPAGALRLVWDALTAPGQAFRAVESKSLVPILAALSICNAAIGWASLEPAKGYTLLLFERAGKTPTEDGLSLLLMSVTIATLVAALLTPLVFWLLQSLAVRVAGFFVDRRIGFARILPVVVLAGVPAVIGNGVRAILVNLRPAEEFARVQEGSAYLAPWALPGSWLHLALKHLDPFSLWSLGLLPLGLAELYRVPRRWAALRVAAGWTLYLALVATVHLWRR